MVICAYTMQRWQDLRASVDSVLAQEWPVDEVLLVIDYNDQLFEAAVDHYGADPRVKVLRNDAGRGLSGARNTGLQAATSDVVAFLDDDARAESSWSRAMVGHYGVEDVAGVGGYAAPQWPAGRPWWLPAEFDWVVGCSYVGQPMVVTPVRNFLGCNMSLRRDAMVSVSGFDSAVGRVGSKPTGCEETELCIRISQRTPSARLLFDPEMRVLHTVTGERTTFRYFVSRCYHEGRSKAMVSRLVGAADGLSSERSYVTKVLPRAVARGLASFSAAGFVRATVVVTGVLLTTLGYAKGQAEAASHRIVR
ncbi:glycosyltransferase family 2 protein [Mycobacterium sp. NPDC006124]|uniref:glycosyltransferase family 2 protein n=1 Tax=Mycobacterium sp. NPDC006124 TaxID=3156729 RepID=UPI0033B0BC64